MSRELVERYVTALNDQDWDSLETCLADDLVRHSVATPDLKIENRQSFLDFLRENAAAFPDLNHRIRMLVCEGNLAACYFDLVGTQTGPLGPLPATGKTVNLPFLSFLRIEMDRIAEMWVEWDNVAFLGQLGLIPEGWPLDEPETAPEH